MATELTKPITVRRQFDAIIESIEQEATEAARTLGLKAKSRKCLLTALKLELDYWEREWCFDPEPEQFATYPKPWDRVVCVEIIRFLLEDIEQYINEEIRSGLDEIDHNLAVLRRRLFFCYRRLPRSSPRLRQLLTANYHVPRRGKEAAKRPTVGESSR